MTINIANSFVTACEIIIMDHTEDFYMILPSNSSPDSHPNNNASDFIVNWENTIELDPTSEWKVAMTEMSYLYQPSSFTRKYSIRYRKCKVQEIKARFYLHYLYKSHQIMHHMFRNDEFDEFFLLANDYFRFNAQITKKGELLLTSDTSFEFAIGPDTKFLDVPAKTYFAKYDKNMSWWYVSLQVRNVKDDLPKDADAIIETDIIGITFYHFRDDNTHHTVDFDRNFAFEEVEEIIAYMHERLRELFKSVEIDQSSGKLVISLQDDIDFVHLQNELHYVLGYSSAFFEASTDHKITMLTRTYTGKPTLSMQWKADYEPHMLNKMKNMFVYASICKPIYVGHSLVPLLKNVFIDTSQDSKTKTVARNHVVYNPMYIPLSATSFNSIEVNIRNDAGELVPFPSSAITSITLHFKQFHKL